jgi:hypothetical protein
VRTINRRQLLATAAAAAVPAITPARVDAQQGSDEGRVGSWYGLVVATNPPLGQFNDLISFHAGGIVTESRRYLVTPTPIGNLLETTGHGAWTRSGGDTFEAFFRFILQDAGTGAPIGTDNVRLSLTLDRESGKLSGTFVSQIRDVADALVIQVGGTYSATRSTV